ncbi:MAG: ABC-F family ATP-binding cassette domain-containing protein [Clostridiales bacterium]|nr:ABC-F family ATP-binding cassette domain-containing protein [Clostridiales bacterium]
MSILQVQNISKSFGTHVLFEGVSFQIAENDRVGLIGPNGCGKTTLLSILNQESEPDSGTVIVSRNCRCESIAQIMDADFEGSLYEIALNARTDLIGMENDISVLERRLETETENRDRLIRRMCDLRDRFESEGGLTYRSRARSTLMGLGFEPEELERPYKSFSGGEIRKAHLARLLLSEPNLLILDEPTNHLDILSTEWLEGYLSEYRGAIITVSHDRTFLDKVTSRTLEIRNRRLTETVGNYSKHLELQLDSDKAAERRYTRTLKEIHRLEGVIEQQRRWNQQRNYVTIASKQKQIDRLREDLVPPERKPDTIRFRFSVDVPPTNEIVRAENLEKSFGGRTVFQNVSFLIKNGEHVCLIGENGCGKTTLLKMLLGYEKSDGGTSHIGDSVRWGYYSQDTSESVDDKTVFDRIYDRFPRMDPKEIKNALAAFLFRGEEIGKKISDLSGGELARIRLLELMLSRRDTLFLDEPTNYLDIASREQLEDAITDFPGTCLVVSHDRYFIDRIADRILILTEDGISEFSGDWDEYVQICQQNRQKRRKKDPGVKKTENAYLAGKEQRSAVNRVKARFINLERQIQVLEKQISEYEDRLQDPCVASDYLKSGETAEALEQAQKQHEELLAEWIELEEEISGFGE